MGPYQALSDGLGDIEARLADMDEAFRSGDVSVLESRSRAVQDSLADALHAFAQVARSHPEGLSALPTSLRVRLNAAQARLVRSRWRCTVRCTRMAAPWGRCSRKPMRHRPMAPWGKARPRRRSKLTADDPVAPQSALPSTTNCTR